MVGNTAAEEALYLSRICSKGSLNSQKEMNLGLKKFFVIEVAEAVNEGKIGDALEFSVA